VLRSAFDGGPLDDAGHRDESPPARPTAELVDARDAVELIRGAIPHGPATWADLGAGDGTFTRALGELLGPGSRIYAVDRDSRAIANNVRSAPNAVTVLPVIADFTRSFDLPGLANATLDGILLANALHFVRDADAVLTRLSAMVRPEGRVVIVEYDRRAPSPWVPHPIPPARLATLAATAGLGTPTVTATRPSAFGGILYVAAAVRLARTDQPRSAALE
jgi:SAM-dependent methyltransferase